MREEELIKKLESVELPEIELQSHRLRTALLNAGHLQRQREVDTMMRGLVSHYLHYLHFPNLRAVLSDIRCQCLSRLPGGTPNFWN